MLSILNEHSLTLAEAAEVIPGRPHRNTVLRWCHTGVNGVKLRSYKCGGKRITSTEAIEEFIAATIESEVSR